MSSSLPPKSDVLRRLDGTKSPKHRGVALEGESKQAAGVSGGGGPGRGAPPTTTTSGQLDPVLLDEFFILHHTLAPLFTITHHNLLRTSLSSTIESALGMLRAAVTNVPISEEAVIQARTGLAKTLRDNQSDSTLLSIMACFIGNSDTAGTKTTPTFVGASTGEGNDERVVFGGDDVVASFFSTVQRMSLYNSSSSEPGLTTTPKPSPSPTSSSYLNKSCYTQTRMDQIVSGLYCGSYHPAADKAILLGAGITHIVCCINVAPRFPNDFTYLVLGADDTSSYDISKHFKATNAFIHSALTMMPKKVRINERIGLTRITNKNEGLLSSPKSDGVADEASDESSAKVSPVGALPDVGGAVLVHCGAGISRAPSVVAAYLMHTLGMSSVAAIQHIQSIRSCASPNPGFRKQLLDYGRRSANGGEGTPASATSASTSPPTCDILTALKTAIQKLN